MESLLPSEIARLVYGYLLDNKCDAAAQLFLESSEFLKECNISHKNGHKFNTKIMGMSLVDMVNGYTNAACLLRHHLESTITPAPEAKTLIDDLKKILMCNDMSKNTSATVLLRLSLTPKNGSLSNKNLRANAKEMCQDVPCAGGNEMSQEIPSRSTEPETSRIAEVSLPDGSSSSKSTSTEEDLDLNGMVQKLLEHTPLHERIAENINRAFDQNGETNNPKTDGKKKIIETVLHTTEADPIFDELLHMLVAPTDETTTPEDTDKENGDPSEVKLDSIKNPTCSQEQETIKMLEAQTNLAVEGILAGNKKLQQETTETVPESVITFHENTIKALPQGATVIGPNLKEGSLVPLTSIPKALALTSTGQIYPIKNSTLPVIGYLSPVQQVRPTGNNSTVKGVLVPPNVHPAVVARAALQPRRRRPIVQKQDSGTSLPVVYQVQEGNEETIERVPVVKKIPEIMRGTRVRTRGGLQKTGIRGVRSIAPQISRVSDDQINVVFRETTSRIQTRSMNKKEKVSPLTKSESTNIITLPPSTEETDKCNDQHKSSPEQKEILEVQQGLLTLNTPVEIESQSRQFNTKDDITITPLVTGEVSSVRQETQPEQSSNGAETLPNLLDSSHVTKQPLQHHLFIDTDKNRKDTENQSTTSLVSEAPDGSIKKIDKQTEINKAILIEEVKKDGTPEQQIPLVKAKGRVSLSTPRRGSHVRVLDFSTPEKKTSQPRKSLTSPKLYEKSKQIDCSKVAVNVKRGIFTSPEQKKVASKSDWDKDLRKFMSSTDMDIPTSVGLKRKTMPKKDVKLKGKAVKPTKKNILKTDLDEEPTKLVKSTTRCRSNNKKGGSSKCLGLKTKIELKGSSEADINDNDKLNNPSVNEKSIEGNEFPKDLSDKVLQTDKCDSSSDETVLNTSSTLSTDNDTSRKSLEKEEERSSIDSIEINKNVTLEKGNVNKEMQNTLETAASLKLTSDNDYCTDEMTSPAKLFGKTISPSLMLSPCSRSYSALESILITEGTRLEKERHILNENPLDGIRKLNDSDNNSQHKSVSFEGLVTQSNEISSHYDKDSLPNDNIRSDINFQTPCKPFDPPPVEMTPVTKVLLSETKIFSTALVTPTIPPTPKPLYDERSPDKANTTPDELLHDDTIGHNSENVVNEETDKTIEEEKCNTTQSKSDNEYVTESKMNPTSTPAVRCSDDSKKTNKHISQTPKVKLQTKENVKSKQCKSTPFKNLNVSPRSSNLKPELVGAMVSKKMKVERKLNHLPTSPSGSFSQFGESCPSSTPVTKRKSQSVKSVKGKLVNRRKISPSKKRNQFKAALREHENEILRECLKNAQAQLFGINTSDSDLSDSDSTSDQSKMAAVNSSSSPQTVDNTPVLTVRNKLLKLESMSMLEGSSDSDTSIEGALPKINEISNKKSENSINKETETKLLPNEKIKEKNDSVQIQLETGTNSDNKKLDLLSKIDKVQNTTENVKLLSRVREESCESFPTLYLSEESNASGRSEALLVKNSKFKKSPSAGSDLQQTKKVENPQNSNFPEHDIENTSNKKQNVKNFQVRSTNSDLPSGSHSQQSNNAIKDVKYLDSSESVIHLKSPSRSQSPSILRRALSEYLDDYTFPITLNPDGRDGTLCQTLYTSPYFSTLDLNLKSSTELRKSSKTHRRKVSNSPESPPLLRDRIKKRNRSLSSSDEERTQYEKEGKKPRRSNGRYRRTESRVTPRREFWGRRRTHFSQRLPPYFNSRRKFESPHRIHNTSWYENTKKRSRHEFRDSSKRSSKRCPDDLLIDPSFHSSKSGGHGSLEKRRHFNESFQSSKSSESDRFHMDQSYRSVKHSELPKDRPSTSRKSLNERTSDVEVKHGVRPVFSSADREDGELSDSSGIHCKKVSQKTDSKEMENMKKVLALIKTQSTVDLLKSVDVENFLTLLHGAEK